MKDNKVSIIVPIYNSANWLKRCIDSVINQTYKDLEIILVDDGSSDNSPEICDKYANEDNRIKVLHKKNEGVSKARNDGIKLSTGEYIKFVDSDDEIELNCCERLVQEITSKSADEVICGFKVYKKDTLLRTPHLDNRTVMIKENIKNFEYIEKLLSSPCNKLYKKELITEKFNDNISAGEDLLFNLNYILNTEKIITITDCLYKVHLDNENSLNRKFREDRLDINLKLLDKQMEVCTRMYGQDIDKNYLYQRYILQLHAYIMNVYENCDNKKTKEIIKKYINNDRIREASRDSKFDRKYYAVFNTLVKNKKDICIYNLVKIRKILLNLLNK